MLSRFSNKSSHAGKTLQIAVFLIFAGRGLQILWSNTGSSELLGFESIMRPIIGPFCTWESYTTRIYPVVAETVNGILGFIWLSCSVAIWGGKRWRKWIWMGSFLLVADQMALLPGDYYGYMTLFNKCLLIFTPFLWLIGPGYAWTRAGRWAIALVFISHGIQAMDIVPRPGLYEDMWHWWWPWGPDADTGLPLVGFLDILAAVALLTLSLPGSVVWIWLTGWGCLTALARLHPAFMAGTDWETVGLAIADVISRLPHTLVPAAIWMQLTNRGLQPFPTSRSPVV